MCEHAGYSEARQNELAIGEAPPTIFRFGALRLVDQGRHGDPLWGPLPLPPHALLSHAMLQFIAEVPSEAPGQPMSVTWSIRSDEGPLTDEIQSAWIPGVGCVGRLDLLHVRTLSSSDLELVARADEYAVIVRPRLVWRVLADVDLTCEHRARLDLRRGKS